MTKTWLLWDEIVEKKKRFLLWLSYLLRLILALMRIQLGEKHKINVCFYNFVKLKWACSLSPNKTYSWNRMNCISLKFIGLDLRFFFVMQYLYRWLVLSSIMIVGFSLFLLISISFQNLLKLDWFGATFPLFLFWCVTCPYFFCFF